MKNLIFVFLFLFSFVKLTAGVLIVEGTFQNRNVYVQNSFGSNGIGYCTTEIKVNGNITTDEVNSSAFEINIAAMNVKPGQKVIIEIKHKSDCIPVVLNPEVLKPSPSFVLVNMSVNAAGVLKWSSKNENGSLPYIIEQYKWNKWVYVGEVEGVGTSDIHDYSFKVDVHSGQNKFRIKQVGLGSIPKISSSVILHSEIDKPNYLISKDNKTIHYSTETAFEIYDAFGSIVKKGFGKEVKIENLVKGKYYLCYDNLITEFDKVK